MKHHPRVLLVLVFGLALCLAACQPIAPGAESGAEPAATVVIYSGRNENLVAPLIAQFVEDTGIDAEVRYGNTAELAATLLEEGDNSPADLFFTQDAGALGAMAAAQRFAPLPQEILDQVDARYRSAAGDWIGVSGRARVVAYNTDNVDPADLPDDLAGLSDELWRGRVGWTPTNAGFQALVTALRVLEGEEAARAWLEAMIANDVQSFESNEALFMAVGAGEIDLGLVNHYYLYQFLEEEGEDFPVANHYFSTPGAGSMMNVGGAGILKTAPHPATAEAFVRYLLTPDAQRYFATETDEYPLLPGIAAETELRPLEELAIPELDLNDLNDLQGTLDLLQAVGAME